MNAVPKHPGADMLRCIRCGARSPDVPEFDACPNCGVSFQTEEIAMTKAAVIEHPSSKRTETEPRDLVPARAELERLEEEIDRVRSAQVVAEWDIGSRLSEIHRGDLWRAGAGGYKSFADYAQQRFDIGKDTARAYLAVAETFSREEASELSITQLWHLARVPDVKERAKLVKQVKEGKIETTRDLAAAVKAKRAAAGLKTERAGLEGTVQVHARLKPGIVAEGEWRETRGGGSEVFVFDIGGARFQVKRSKGRGKAVQVSLLGSSPVAEKE